MKKTATKALMTVPTEEALAELRQEFPAEQSFSRTLLPRIGMVSQDQTEEVKNKTTGKKEIKLVTEAGTFFVDRQTDEEDEFKKKIWEKTELGMETECVIVFQRKQLKFYDESTEEYTSSPIYDREDEIIPLFLNKTEIDRGTPKELKSREKYQIVKNGKTKSALEDNRILYVLYEDEIYQMNLRGSSMYAFMTWAKKVLPPAVKVKLASQPMEKGDISWNQMTFEVVRNLSAEEVADVMGKVKDIKEAIEYEKSFYANAAAEKEDGQQKSLDKF